MWRSTNTPAADGGGTSATLTTGGSASNRSLAEATSLSLSLPASPSVLLRSSPVTHASASASAAQAATSKRRFFTRANLAHHRRQATVLSTRRVAPAPVARSD